MSTFYNGYLPSRTFGAVEGDKSKDNQGPVAIVKDIETLMKMTNPNADIVVGTDTYKGGIGERNIQNDAIKQEHVKTHTPDQNTASVMTGPLRIFDFMSIVSKLIKGITGKANWYEAPADTIESLNTRATTLESNSVTTTAFTTHKTSGDHDGRYYTETEINAINLAHTTSGDHDGRYYTETEIDGFVSTINGNLNTHKSSGDHDSRYYTKTQMQTSGQSATHWDNITNKPDLADKHWKTPVATPANLPLTGNEIGDVREVMNDGDGKLAWYACEATTGTLEQQWEKIGDADWQIGEDERVAAENIRLASEITREDNEDIRISNENTRITSASAFALAETNRNNAEITRSANEVTRIASENIRVANASAYTTAENTRVTQELGRIAAENTRVSQESSRVTQFNAMIANSNCIFKAPVATYADIATTYPSPSAYWTTQTIDDGKVWRRNGSNNAWEQVGTISSSAFTSLVSYVDTTLGYALNANNDIVRESIPSGLTQLGTLDTTYMATNANKIRLTGDSVAFVNGYKVTISSLTVIDLGTPPVSGTRDDLIFLEVWLKSVPTSKSDVVQSRIRVVQGVDFTTYPIDGFVYQAGANVDSWAEVNQQFMAQGGAASPLTNRDYGAFIPAVQGSSTYFVQNHTLSDAGLYVSGKGNQASKDALLTSDGYVYAIPLFKVTRRNSGGYSVANPNGGRTYRDVSGLRGSAENTAVNPVIKTNLHASFSLLEVGDSVVMTANLVRKIIAIDSVAKTFTIDFPLATATFGASNGLSILSNRPDTLLADIIADRDIVDLRHKVSLTGFNYQGLLEENFDKLLRGELQTKERKKMVKTYHGIPKTPTDANTVFYASCESVTAEVGTIASNLSAVTYSPVPTGIGMNLKDSANTRTILFNVSNLSAFTFDGWFNTEDLYAIGANARIIFNMYDATKVNEIGFSKRTSGDTFSLVYGNGSEVLAIPKPSMPWTHVRLSSDGINIKVYFNGKLIKSRAVANLATKTRASIGEIDGVTTWTYIGRVADVSFSNIDRGDVFATLPADFIAGYAKVTNAMNGQRKTHSDALTGQYTVGIADGDGSSHSKGLTITKAGANWASADTIKVKGLAGDIISGVIDSDTALARVTGIVSGAGTTTYIFYLDDVTKLAVSDVLTYVDANNLVSSRVWTVSAIDTTTKQVTLTLNSSTDIGTTNLGYFIEYTATTSIPVVKSMISSTMTTITGTWSGLGTNEATFTLGTNASLTTGDIQIEYSLNIPAGQGGLPEVYTATLAGESKGKKLVVGTVAVSDDFVGKVSGSTVVNPNGAYHIYNSSLLSPSAFMSDEEEQANYDKIKTLNGVTLNPTTSVNGQIPQQLFSFNLIRIVEDKYGPIPSVDKVAWLKSNLGLISAKCYGYGTGPLGNKAKMGFYRAGTSAWHSTVVENTATSPSLLTYARDYSQSPSVSEFIDSNGFVHFNLYTDASDGTTPSIIYTDYINIEVALKTPTGYDILVPENPRRDGGLTNVLMVRKETKEIQSFFDSINTDGLITYGDYVPYQGLSLLGLPSLSGAVLSSKMIISTIGTGGKAGSTQQFYDKMSTQLPLGLAETDYALDSRGVLIKSTNPVPFMETPFTVTPFSPISIVSNPKIIRSVTGATSPVGVRGCRPDAYFGISDTLDGLYGVVALVDPDTKIGVFSSIYAVLVLDINKNEIYMVVARKNSSGKFSVLFDDNSPLAGADHFKLSGRPLVKGV